MTSPSEAADTTVRIGTCDDGMVIDLSPMKGVRVDPAAKTVRVDGGCTLGDVDHATHPFGMAVPTGIMSTTGVGGLTLGGGLGHLARSFGLTIDSLLEVDVVLADGRLVTANASQNQDLFWAVRGGGGNFGVVTSFLFKLHPVSMVYAGPMLWHLDQAADVLRWYRDYIVTAPKEMNGWFAFLSVPPGAPFPKRCGRRRCVGSYGVIPDRSIKRRKCSARFETSSAHLRWISSVRTISGAANHVRPALSQRAAVVLACRLD